jgi:hypothetical protein
VGVGGRGGGGALSKGLCEFCVHVEEKVASYVQQFKIANHFEIFVLLIPRI